MKILIMVYGPLGDSLFTIPALKSIRLGYPEADIKLITSTTALDFFKYNENINQIITVSDEREFAKKIVQLRDIKFDLVLALSRKASCFLPLSKAENKAGFTGEDMGFLYYLTLPDCRTTHAIDYCLAITEKVGGKAVDAKQEFRLSVDQSARERVIRKLAKKTEGLYDLSNNGLPLLAVHPGGKYFKLKRWPLNKYQQLIKQLDSELPLQIVLIGGNDEKEDLVNLIDDGYNYNNVIVDLIGELSLSETTALLALADLFVGNDSAPQHIAAAVKTPVIVLFGPTSPKNYHPYGTKYEIITKEVECSPCFTWLGSLTQYLPQYLPDWARGCTGDCMKQIKVEEVFFKVKAMLPSETFLQSDKSLYSNIEN